MTRLSRWLHAQPKANLRMAMYTGWGAVVVAVVFNTLTAR